MGKFGWSYPPGAANDPYAPYNQTDEPCAICGKWPDDCICPECPVCGEQGNPRCYITDMEVNHGLIELEAQTKSRLKAEAQWAEDQAYREEYGYEENDESDP